MSIEDVQLDTQLELSNGYKNYNSNERNVSVTALKPCGCDGPWIGTLKTIPYKDWTEEMKEARMKLPYSAKCWAIYPVSKSDHYSVYKKSIGWALGKQAAAERLREFIAHRNTTVVRTGRYNENFK